MAHYVATATTTWPPDVAFAYMADLRNFAEWDPGVKAVRPVSGEPGVEGSTFDVDVRNAGRTMTLRYVTVESDAPRRLLVQAETALLRSIDEVRIEQSAEGTTVVYDARLELRGVARLLDPALRPVFKRIGDRAAAGLRARLAGTP